MARLFHRLVEAAMLEAEGWKAGGIQVSPLVTTSVMVHGPELRALRQSAIAEQSQFMSARLVFGAVTLAWCGFLAWLTWHVI
jgi:hypothetical protein